MLLQNIKRVFKKPDKEKEQELNKNINEYGLEKKDLPAMILSAYIVFIPIALIVLGLFALIAWIFVR